MDKNSIPSSSKSLDQQHVQKTKLNKGYAVIFNHEKFEPFLCQTERMGTEHDVTALRDVFELFHVEVFVKNNLPIKEIDSEVKRLQYFDFTPYECLIIVILTHGKEQNILYASDCTYDLHDRVVNQIVTPNKSLIGKPKIFIIQACKGNIDSNAFIQKDARVSSSSIQIPFITDMFFAFSTYEGFASNRDIRSGGIFIQSFCQMLKEYGSTEVITKIMERVTKNLVINNKMQVPTLVATMTKPFIFGDIGRGSVSTFEIISDEIFMRKFREMLQTKQSPELIAQITRELNINPEQSPNNLTITENTTTVDESTRIKDLRMKNSKTLDLNHINYDDITLITIFVALQFLCYFFSWSFSCHFLAHYFKF